MNVQNAIAKIDQAIKDCKDTHTAWGGQRTSQKEKALLGYMAEILDNITERYNYQAEIKERPISSVTRKEFEEWTLNGAENWHHYSWGGCSLVYNVEIIEYIYPRYMVAPLLRKCDKGYFQPLDIQAAFLKSAFIRTWWKFAAIQKTEEEKENKK